MDKQILAASGFDLNWLQQMEAKYGPTIFGVIGDLLNQGFSTAWVVATVDKLHPLMMDVLYQVFNLPSVALGKCAALGAPADVAAGLGGSLDSVVSKDMMIFIIQKAITLLPTLGLSGWKLMLVQSGLNILLSVLQGA